MSRRDARAPSQRQLRVGEEVRHAIAWALERGEVRDPDVHNIAITVTEVRISPDLRNATAFIVPLGGGAEAELKKVLSGLNRAVPYLRKVIAKGVHLRNVPRLNFIADSSFDEASHIDRLLRNPTVARDLARKTPSPELEPELEQDPGSEDKDGA
jgi:ribosome-binding factor A